MRTIIPAKEEEALEWAMAYLQSPEAEEVMRERSVFAEGVVGEVKVLHGHALPRRGYALPRKGYAEPYAGGWIR